MRILMLYLAWCLLTTAEPVPPPASPIAQRASELTVKHRQFFDWALVEAFRRVGAQQPWRADAEAFLGDLGRALAAKEAEAQAPELIAAGRKLLAAGCDDPLVRLRLGMLLGNGTEGSRLVSGCIEPLRARQGTPAAYPTIHLVSALRRQTDPRTRKLSQEAARELPDLIDAGSREALAAPCGRAVAIDGLTDWFAPLFESGGLGKDDIDRTLAKLDAPGGDPALAGVLRGRAAITAAWGARGGGWANSVTEEGWKGFRAGLAEARRSLTAAWQACPDSSSAAWLMITVTMGDGSGEQRLWFDRACTADPGCGDAWERMSTALLPRWGGSTQELLALARSAVTEARPGNRLDRIAGDLLHTYVWEDGDEAAAWREIGRLDGLCPPAPGPGQLFRAMGVAWHSGQQPQALELFARLGGMAMPHDVLDRAPFPLAHTRRMLLTIERARLGQSAPVVRPIPVDGTSHRSAQHAPSYATLLPALWQAHGRRDPAWDARILAHLEAPTSANSSASKLVEDGCTDPLIRFLACNEKRDPDPAARRAVLLACWDGLEAASYPPVVVWQPAWFLIQSLHQDKGKEKDKAAAAERARLMPRFSALATALALSANRDGVTGGMLLLELGEPPAQDPALLDLIDRAAAAPGVEAALASGLTGLTTLHRVMRLPPHDPQRSRMAWTTLARLWPAWTAYRHAKAAAALSTAACLANMPVEARCWFDEAVRLAYDDSLPWRSLGEGYAQTGSPEELLAFAAEIAALPASSGATLRALDPVRAVLMNRALHNPKRLQSAWASVQRATSGRLADSTLSAGLRSQLLYWRIACAALAGDRPSVAADLQALGAPFDPKLLPRGLNPAKIVEVVSEAQPPEPAKPKDF